jgi:uncharacterized glyoxalase superfamily protein PhnB
MAKVSAVPAGMHTVTPGLVVDGAIEFIEWAKKALGATEQNRAMDPSGKKIWHSELKIGDSIIYVNDGAPEMGAPAQPSRLWLYMEGVDAAFQRAVNAGATVTMKMEDMFWGDRMGQVKDKWGNSWSFAQRMKEMTPDEMKKAEDEFVAKMQKMQQQKK